MFLKSLPENIFQLYMHDLLLLLFLVCSFLVVFVHWENKYARVLQRLLDFGTDLMTVREAELDAIR